MFNLLSAYNSNIFFISANPIPIQLSFIAGNATSKRAGLHPILIDPFGDHEGEDFERITSVRDLVDELIAT